MMAPLERLICFSSFLYLERAANKNGFEKAEKGMHAGVSLFFGSIIDSLRKGNVNLSQFERLTFSFP